MLKHRLIFGFIFALALVGIFKLDTYLAGNFPKPWWISPPGAVIALVMVIIIPLALREMQALLEKEHVIISMRICVVASILCMIWPWIDQVSDLTGGDTQVNYVWSLISNWFRTVKPHYLVPTVIAASLVGAFTMYTRNQKIEGAMANAGGSLLAIVYLGVLPGFFLPICLTHGSWMMLGIIAIVKAADIGAYATGRLVGKRKLIKWLSPGKTVEGFIGGLVAAGLVGVLVAWIYESGPSHTTIGMIVLKGSLLGMLLGAVGQLGDLVESLLKRDAGVKDSGNVPGFGGILDLLDSPLLAAPAAYWALKLLGHA